jgi:hypothetical protein
MQSSAVHLVPELWFKAFSAPTAILKKHQTNANTVHSKLHATGIMLSQA